MDIVQQQAEEMKSDATFKHKKAITILRLKGSTNLMLIRPINLAKVCGRCSTRTINLAKVCGRCSRRMINLAKVCGRCSRRMSWRGNLANNDILHDAKSKDKDLYHRKTPRLRWIDEPDPGKPYNIGQSRVRLV